MGRTPWFLERWRDEILLTVIQWLALVVDAGSGAVWALLLCSSLWRWSFSKWVKCWRWPLLRSVQVSLSHLFQLWSIINKMLVNIVYFAFYQRTFRSQYSLAFSSEKGVGWVLSLVYFYEQSIYLHWRLYSSWSTQREYSCSLAVGTKPASAEFVAAGCCRWTKSSSEWVTVTSDTSHLLNLLLSPPCQRSKLRPSTWMYL